MPNERSHQISKKPDEKSVGLDRKSQQPLQRSKGSAHKSDNKALAKFAKMITKNNNKD